MSSKNYAKVYSPSPLELDRELGFQIIKQYNLYHVTWKAVFGISRRDDKSRDRAWFVFCDSLVYGLVISFLHPEGYWVISRDSLHVAISLFRILLYPVPRTSALPASAKIPSNIGRNREIYNRYSAGERAQKLANEFGISVRRVNWLINRFRQNTIWYFQGWFQFNNFFSTRADG
jgi:hypothetical protein